MTRYNQFGTVIKHSQSVDIHRMILDKDSHNSLHQTQAVDIYTNQQYRNCPNPSDKTL